MASIANLFGGPIDLVGDVHGEFDALINLMRRLGYSADGSHGDGRRLVFVGDLCDRGPDSPAVLDLVMDLVARGRAQCVLGNHELNILRASRKEGNGWIFEHDHDRAEGKFTSSKSAEAGARGKYLDFLLSLPLALENSDLRVVHACWSNSAVAEVRRGGAPNVIQQFNDFDEASRRALEEHGFIEAAAKEEEDYRERLGDQTFPVPMLPATAAVDEANQMANPVRVLTSGVERAGKAPFFSSGKWRMVERVAWWNEYEDSKPVVIGHYWRWPKVVDRGSYGKGGPDLFDGASFDEPLGLNMNVYCIDYSVGRRYQERGQGQAFQTRLGALRWPERIVVFDQD